MQKLKIFLIADIYPKKENLEFFQEWESEESVAILKSTLEEMGHIVKVFEPFLNKREFLSNLLAVSLEERNQVILWNLVEGYFSRNREAYIPALAEFLGYPFTGSDTYAQILSLDKALTKQFVRELGIPTPKFQLIENFRNAPNIEFPAFIKPNYEGSSLGIAEQNLITSLKDWEEFQKNSKLEYLPYLLEEYLEGKEYTVGILGSKKQLFPTKVLEVIYPSKIYSAATKSKSEMPEKFLPMSDQLKEKWIQEKSLQIAHKIGVSGFARLDWKEKKEEPYFLEINLTPGLSKIYSALPICALSSEISYEKLLRIILEAALSDYEEKSRDYGKNGY